MASPMAVHWRKKDQVQVQAVHDRGSPGERREHCRSRWQEYGTRLVPSLEELFRPEPLDGIFICCGKNGDDLPLISKLGKLLSEQNSKSEKPFICHMSTVSACFSRAAADFCQSISIDYLNYPLTGGPAGAEKASMLILASGSKELFEKLAPILNYLGNPRYFGERIEAAPEVKLIGHLMVFNGLLGICSALSLHSECFQNGKLGGREQTDFFDFLNTGAGGTTQWNLIARLGIKDGIWHEPFPIKYAAIDAIYAAQLCLERKVSLLAIQSIVNIALAFSYLLNSSDTELATHALVREMIQTRKEELDQFIIKHSAPLENQDLAIKNCVASLPNQLAASVALSVDRSLF